MTGAVSFVYIPDKEKKKEYMISALEQAFKNLGMESFCINLVLPDALQKLADFDAYFKTIPDDKKHFLFF